MNHEWVNYSLSLSREKFPDRDYRYVKVNIA